LLIFYPEAIFSYEKAIAATKLLETLSYICKCQLKRLNDPSLRVVVQDYLKDHIPGFKVSLISIPPPALTDSPSLTERASKRWRK
jgi:hypothetical protein